MLPNCTDVFEGLDLPFRCFFNPCLTHEMVSHDDIEFIWLFEGEVDITCENQQYRLKADQVFIFNMRQNHALKALTKTVSLSFRLKKDYIEHLSLYFEKVPFTTRIFTIDELSQKYHQVPLILSQLATLLKSTHDASKVKYRLLGYYNMYVYDLYTVRLKEKYLDIKKKNYDVYLLRFHAIDAYLNAHFGEKVTLTSIASMVGLTPNRLSHFIKEILGLSFQEYLQTLRFENALLLLRNTDLPIKAVAINCGFSDQKYLNQMMKARFHLTALNYRKIMRDDVNYGLKDTCYADLLVELNEKLHYFSHHPPLKDPLGQIRHLL